MPRPTELRFFAEGLPKTQGSLTPRRVKVKGKGWRLRNVHPEGLEAWRSMVRLRAREAMARHRLFDEPMVLLATFALVRPPSVKRLWPSSQRDGDADKYLRAIGDALEGVAFKNDGRVVGSASILAYHELIGLEGPGVLVELSTLGGKTPTEALARLLT